ncbi:MAG: cell division protein FtsB [Pseudohongiellaceae bacterium]
MKLLTAILLLILLALQFRLWSGPGSFANIARLEAEIETQQQDNAILEQRNNVLYAEVSELKSGLDAIEERARDDLGMIRKGETFYLIVEDENQHP